jgi:hypothetical protein
MPRSSRSMTWVGIGATWYQKGCLNVRLPPGNIRLHYNCRSQRAEPIPGANAPASETAAYCWKQTSL